LQFLNTLGKTINTNKKNIEDDLNLHYCESIRTCRITEALLYASGEVDLDVNTGKTKYMFMSCHQNAGCS